MTEKTQENLPHKDTDVPKTFDAKAIGIFQQCMQDMRDKVPELKGAIIIFNWHEPLNNGSPLYCWETSRGGIQLGDLLGVDTMAGQIQKTLGVLHEVQSRQIMALREEIQNLVDQRKEESERGPAPERDSTSRPVAKLDRDPVSEKPQ